MNFYRDIITSTDAPQTLKYRYHTWSPASIAAYWDACVSNPFIRGQFYPMAYWQDLLAWASDRISETPAHVVDIGCGPGNLVACARGIYRSSQIRGIDLTEESLSTARQRFKADPAISFTVGSFEALPLENDSVDLVTCTEVLDHPFPDTFAKSFSEVARILRTGGHYVASIPFDESINLVCCPECRSVFTPYQHMMFEISRSDIRNLLSQNGLELIDFYQALDRSAPANPVKRALKPLVINWIPGLAKRLFPQSGVAGFLARKSASHTVTRPS
jgi:ubiquinone/menaquinone biosynthesis C-methylase UbiE